MLGCVGLCCCVVLGYVVLCCSVGVVLDFVIVFRAATNDYFNNRLICRLFFRLIDESDKKKKHLELPHLYSKTEHYFKFTVQTEV